MITISRPYIEECDEEIFLKAKVRDEGNAWEDTLWFSVEREYGSFFCTDYADSFLLLALLPAIKSGQDIRSEAPVSRKLLFNVHNGIEPLFRHVFHASKQIRIEAEAKDDIVYHGSGVGCGCSLGVDSLSSFLQHFNPETMPGYRVTHLALFNSGQLGDYDMAASEENFRRSVKELQPFSEAVQLPVVGVNSNLNAYYLACKVTLLNSFTTRTCACAMALQKLFGKYVYASSYSVCDISYSSVDVSHMEAAYMSLCCTENFEAILSNPVMSRVEKTDFIRTWPLTPRFLQVCWAEQVANEAWHKTIYLEGKTKTNCGWCDKCLRTLLTLELLTDGDLSAYEQSFHLEKYREYRRAFIIKVFRGQRRNVFYKELVQLMQEKGIRLPLEARLWHMAYRVTQSGADSIKHLVVLMLNGVASLFRRRRCQ